MTKRIKLQPSKFSTAKESQVYYVNLQNNQATDNGFITTQNPDGDHVALSSFKTCQIIPWMCADTSTAYGPVTQILDDTATVDLGGLVPTQNPAFFHTCDGGVISSLGTKHAMIDMYQEIRIAGVDIEVIPNVVFFDDPWRQVDPFLFIIYDADVLTKDAASDTAERWPDSNQALRFNNYYGSTGGSRQLFMKRIKTKYNAYFGSTDLHADKFGPEATLKKSFSFPVKARVATDMTSSVNTIALGQWVSLEDFGIDPSPSLSNWSNILNYSGNYWHRLMGGFYVGICGHTSHGTENTMPLQLKVRVHYELRKPYNDLF